VLGTADRCIDPGVHRWVIFDHRSLSGWADHQHAAVCPVGEIGISMLACLER
jgi:hypothetical protein